MKPVTRLSVLLYLAVLLKCRSRVEVMPLQIHTKGITEKFKEIQAMNLTEEETANRISVKMELLFNGGHKVNISSMGY